MTPDHITVLLSTGLFIIYAIKIFLIVKFSNSNIDEYNHTAFIKSLSHNYRIPNSAYRETNKYPFLIHLMMKKIKHPFIRKYFSFFIEILGLFVAAIYYSSIGLDLSIILTAILILSLSTTGFAQSYFFNARILGLFFFNAILFTTLSDLSILTKVLIEFFCFVIIFLASKFAHQAFILLLTVPAIIFSKTDIFLSYALAISFSYVITKGFILEIFRAHFMHCYWSYFNQMDIHVFGNYYREVENTLHLHKEFDIVRAGKKLLTILQIPVLLLLPYMVLMNDTFPVTFSALIICTTIFWFIVLAVYTRLDRTIGECGRYFEYMLVPLTLYLYQTGTYSKPYFNLVLLFVFFSSFLLVFYKIRRMINNNANQGFVYKDKNVEELLEFLALIPRSKIVSLPIGISNFLTTVLKHDFFYPYSYYGQYFLSRKGFFPFFKFNKYNLLNQNYVDYLVVDDTHTSQSTIMKIIEKYNFENIFSNSTYTVYRKNKTDVH